jgi:hypothetical protein
MITFISSYTKKRYRMAENFSELTAGQLCRIAGLLLSGMDQDTARLEALRILLRMNRLRFYFLNLGLKTQLFDQVEWLFEKNQVITNLIPSYRRNLSVRLYGPKQKLINLRMSEFHACEMRYRMILDQVPGALEELIAILYREPVPGYDRKKDSAGDIRQPYNGNTVPYRAGLIRRWPANVKYAVLLFYDGCRQLIIDQHPEVFTSGDQDTISNEDQFQGMFMMIRGLAADGKYGTFEEVEQLYVYTALNELTQLIQENKEMEEKLKNPTQS